MVAKTLRILIADDDDVQRLLLKRMLEKNYSCEVLEAKNGVEVLRLVDEWIPAVIFLDIWMPIMNGIQVVEKLKESQEYNTIPIIILSAIGDKEMIARIISLGVSDYILKPVRSEQVMERLNKILSPTKENTHNLA